MNYRTLQFVVIMFFVFNNSIVKADLFMCTDENGGKTYHESGQKQKSCVELDMETKEEKQNRARQSQDFPKMGMKIYDNKMLCVNYGKTLRGEKKSYFTSAQGDLTLMRKELKVRKLKVEDSITKQEKIKMGMTVCGLYATFGEPRDENESVGSWGVHVQHIFGDTFVYTENGKVTSWQQ